MTTPLIQIYTMQTSDEALAVAALGVDNVGVTPADRGLPGEVDNRTAAEICTSVRGQARSVALSVEDDLDRIIAMVDIVQPDILHLCGRPGAVGPDAVAELRNRLSPIPIMQAVAVTGADAVATARAYETVVDYLILDSVDPRVDGIGAAGVVHDWTLSASIVAAVSTPVVLAGGLSPENVAAAIDAVRPWGVDSLTHTNAPLGNGRFRKNLERVSDFVEAARGWDRQ